MPTARQKKLDQLYIDIASLTAPRCASCTVSHSCCEALYCELAIEAAAKRGVTLERTDHPKLPLMGPNGCTAVPYFRPICAVHVCERHYAADVLFGQKYFALRDKITEMEWELDLDEESQQEETATKT